MKKKILIVDDITFNIEFEANLVQSLMDELKQEIEIDSAINIKEALEAIEKKTYDAILIDINLPDGNGVEIAKAAQAKNDTTRLAGITIFPENYEDIHQYFDLFLKKPIMLDTYKKSFSRLLQVD